MRKLLIAFDLDDTLYPEKDYILSGFKAVSQVMKNKFGGNDICPELIKTFKNGERRKTFNTTLERLGIKHNESLIKEMVDYYRMHFPDIIPYNDVVPTLKLLKQHHNLVLITDGYLEVQKIKVKILNIQRFFKKIIFTDEYGRDYWKPNPKTFQMLMSDFSANKDECVYIGDNIEKDFFAPNQLGWLTIQIIRKDKIYCNNFTNKEYEPKIKIKSLLDLNEILRHD